MFERPMVWRQIAITIPAASSFLLASADKASAHVKWFCAYDITGQPRGLENVLCTDFYLLMGLSIYMLLFGCLIEKSWVGRTLTGGLNTALGFVDEHAPIFVRLACGFFLVSVWALGGIILTPELTTTLTWVSWLQLALAACLLFRQTLILTALGLVFLFALAIKSYGLFHLLDYPVFLGLSAYLALTGFGRTYFGIRPVEILRWTAAITLMWASVEKWAYPEWSFGLFVTYPDVTMGFEPEFFMRAAGAVEFTLSFAILLGSLVRRVASLILLGVFVSAIGEFGMIDAIGHSPIIAVLLIIAADRAPGGSVITVAVDSLRALWKDLGLVTAGYGTSLAASLAAYYLLHAVIFGPTTETVAALAVQ